MAWVITVLLLALGGMILVGVVSVVCIFATRRKEPPDQGHDRAEKREQKWYPLA
jgi:hypothetical protein